MDIRKTLEACDEAKMMKKQYSIGDSIFFGNYPQDADEIVRPIEWMVLKKEDKVLLLSKYVLDSQSYDGSWKEITWEMSYIREWLNNEFYGIAFNNAEKKKIQTTLVKTEDNPISGTRGGNDTKDKVFF